MAKVKFNATCLATYTSELEVPDAIVKDFSNVLDYVRYHLPDAPVLEMEFRDALDDPCDAVTAEDIRCIGGLEV